MTRTLGTLALVCSLALLAPAAASAHAVVVDGSMADWTVSAAPTKVNTGHIHRNAGLEGEYLWTDAMGDERTDFSGGPDGRVDIRSFAVTSDATNLYFLVQMADIDVVSGDGAPQVQIAIDLDRVFASGGLEFRGFADTTLVGEAAWEFLVQTRFGSGSPPAVWNTAGANVATGAAAVADATTEVIEIAVPWADLGLASDPTGPIAFTTATFRANPADDTWDVLSASNALDCVTNNFNPGAGSVNTWSEVMDGDVDYHFELWMHLDPNIEPSAPLLVSEVLYDTGASEWIEVFNASGTDLDLAGWHVGDEETAGGGEGMFLFPAGARIRAGHVAVVANSATTFAATWGRNPNFELTVTDPFVPNMVADAAWAAGTLALANTGDEVLILDRFYTVLDVLVYEGGVYPGVTSHAGTTANNSLFRVTSRRDTDNGANDFGIRVAPSPTPGNPSTPCVDEDLVNLPDGTACDDGNPCNEGEACVAGSCSGGAAVVCAPDGNGCTRDVCTLAFNGCWPPEATGTGCDDGLRCTTGETCTAGAVCTGGAPVVCPAPATACDLASCDPTTGCRATAGTSCEDGNACTTGDACNAAGACIPGAGALVCDDANPCTDDACDAALGCTFTPNSAPCSDGSGCTVGDACSGGACVPGAPVSCDDANACTDDSCSPASGCTFAFNAAPCDDADACTAGDACALGACAPGAALVCNDGNGCTDDACNSATGCVFVANTASCTDGDACTTGDVCAGGVCAPSGTLGCSDANSCTADSCSPASGCVFDPAPFEGATCDDGLYCTIGETCSAGACGAGTPNGCSDGNGCTADACDEATDACVSTPLADGTPCASAGGCRTGGTCTGAVCSAVTPEPAGTPCDDADACTDPDTCDGAGNCGGIGRTCDDLNPCTADACDPATGCSFANVADGTACDDADACTDPDTCLDGACTGTPVPGCGMDGGDAGEGGEDGGDAAADPVDEAVDAQTDVPVPPQPAAGCRCAAAGAAESRGPSSLLALGLLVMGALGRSRQRRRQGPAAGRESTPS